MRLFSSDFQRDSRAAILAAGGLLCLLATSTMACGDSDDRPTTVDVTFRVTVPSDTPADSKVFIAGNFQAWDPGSAAHELTRQADGRFAITLAFEPGTGLEFKFTRGSWEVGEKGPTGEEIMNRTLLVTQAGTHDFTVARWSDGTPPPSTITGNVSMITVPGFLSDRRVWVYLPPGYNSDLDVDYPVLYMFDGQNVFDQATSFAGFEWKVDETCEMLIATNQIQPIIVVAVDHGGSKRIDEYTPWVDPGRQAGGAADMHLNEIVGVLVPYINQTYRTRNEPSDTAIAGSSLGGLLSLYAGYKHAATFGLIAALSPSIWWDGEHLISFIESSDKPASRIYMDMGTLEEGTLADEDDNGIDDSIDDLRALRRVLIGQNFIEGQDLVVVEDEDGRHSEAFWAERFPEVLKFLFPPVDQPARGPRAPR